VIILHHFSYETALPVVHSSQFPARCQVKRPAILRWLHTVSHQFQETNIHNFLNDFQEIDLHFTREKLQKQLA